MTKLTRNKVWTSYDCTSLPLYKFCIRLLKMILMARLWKVWSRQDKAFYRNNKQSLQSCIGTPVKVIWVCFSLFTLLLAPFSVAQSQAMGIENTTVSVAENSTEALAVSHQASIMAPKHTASQAHHELSNQHECCSVQIMNDLLKDSCENLECDQDCGHCLGSASYFATLHVDTHISPYVPLSTNARYHFSLQVMVNSPQTPPPNA